MDSDYAVRMRFLVTGASGFIGSAVVRALVNSGHDVAALQRRETSVTRLAGVPVTTIWLEDSGGSLSKDQMGSLTAFSPDAVIHAGWAGVGNSSRNDEQQFENLALTLNILRAARDSGARHFIGLGSQAEYGPVEGSITETQSLAPTSLYGAAKAAAYFSTAVLAAQFNMEFSWVRIFSTYGPGDAPHWMIQNIAAKLLRNEPADLTPGTQMWDYLYVDDAATAIRTVAESPVGLGALNLGSGSAITIREIVEKLHAICHSRSELHFGRVPFRSDQVMHLQADTAKLRQTTGWEPLVTLDDGLLLTVNAIREGFDDPRV